MNQNAPIPAMLTATADVKFALLLALALFQDGDVVGPAISRTSRASFSSPP